MPIYSWWFVQTSHLRMGRRNQTHTEIKSLLLPVRPHPSSGSLPHPLPEEEPAVEKGNS